VIKYKGTGCTQRGQVDCRGRDHVHPIGSRLHGDFHRQQFASPLLVSVAPGGLPWWGCFFVFFLPHCHDTSREPHYILMMPTHANAHTRTRTKQPTACTSTYQEAGTTRWCRVRLSASSRLYKERASEREREREGGGGREGERERARARASATERERYISYIHVYINMRVTRPNMVHDLSQYHICTCPLLFIRYGT
jgi:hypothetical protein